MWHAVLDLPDELRARYEALAAQTGQPLETIVSEALEAHLARLDEDDARLAAAMAEADRGETVDADQVHAEMAALLAARGVTPEQLAAIRAEVRAEAEAAYGVPLCD